METQLILTAGAILGLLVVSAFFSGSETSLTAASKARMHILEQNGNHRAAVVNRMWQRKERLIGAILLGNNLVNIMASALATSLLITLFGEAGVAYATLGMTLLVLVFAEVLPKTYALYHPDRMALAVAPVMRVVVTTFGPITQLVQAVVDRTLRAFGVRAETGHAFEQWEEELRGAIDLHKGVDDEESRHEREMLRSILDLGDVEVGDIMIHRRNVLTLNADDPPAALIEQVMASPYTRLPVWRGSPENIVGVLHVRALFRAVQQTPDIDSLDIVSVASEPWFIPDSTDLLSQLQAFRTRKEHIAIVVDEYGEMLGIVTLEDILEEIVGDISDELDVKLEGFKPLADGSVEVAGTVTIRDLNRRCNWRLPDEEASTVAGLVLHEARCIPEPGQRFAFHGFSFEILERHRNQITRLRVIPQEDPGQDSPAASEQAEQTSRQGESPRKRPPNAGVDQP